MMLRPRSLLAVLVLALAVVCGEGCGGGGGRKPQDIPVSPSNDPLEPARTVLRRYAAGQPMGSEATSFPHMVSELRKVDANRADVLEQGLEEIKKNPGQAAELANALLAKLAPAMK